MQAGLARHGVPVERFDGGYIPSADVVCCWGWRNGKVYRASERQVLVAERGYVGDRFAWTSLGWNGLNGRATFPTGDGLRWEKHFAGLIQPWKSGGEYVLLAGQVEGDQSLAGVNIKSWYAEAAAAMTAYGLPVYFRPHPEAVRRGQQTHVKGAPVLRGSLADALSGAAVVVTYNSNTGVDAVLAGVPTVACDRGSMAWDVTGHEIGETVTPDRTEWAHRIAWAQWEMSEIADGTAWDAVRGVI